MTGGNRRTNNISSCIHLRQHTSRVGGWDYKVGNNGNGFDLLGPLEFLVVADIQGWLGGLFAGVNATSGRRKNLTQRNLYPRYIFRLEFIQISSDKASEERGGNIVRVSLWNRLEKQQLPLGTNEDGLTNHQTIIQ